MFHTSPVVYVLCSLHVLDSKSVVNKLPPASSTEELTYGLVANLVLKDYSTSYRYELQTTVGEDQKTLIDIEPSGLLQLKDEVQGKSLCFLSFRSREWT